MKYFSRALYLVRYTQENYAGKTGRDLSRGSSTTDLIKQYGTPAYTFPSSSGEYWLYPDYKLAFEISSNGQVKNWLFYAKVL